MPENIQKPAPAAKPGDASPAAEGSETTVSPPITSTGGSAPARQSGAALDWAGEGLGKYRVSGVLGQGAMGLVLKAR